MGTIRDSVIEKNSLEYQLSILCEDTLNIIKDHFADDADGMEAWLSVYNPYLKDVPSRMLSEGRVVRLLTYVNKYCI